jgi:hypothetical protein
MREGSSEPGPELPAGTSDGEATRTLSSRGPVSPPPGDDLADPSARPLTEVVSPHPAAEVVGHGSGLAYAVTADQAGRMPEDVHGGQPPPEIVRYGPGVPASPPAGRAELTAERTWRNTGPAKPSGRQAGLGALLGWAVTVILLAASGVLLYLRFHHAPFHVTGVAITQQAKTGCGMDVTGRITTNGSAGTVSYQWLFRPGQQPPQPLSQSVLAGQHAVYVSVALEGQGHGSAARAVTLQVLGPDTATATTAVMISC